MTNKIIGIQGDKLDKINISSDTSIFLAHEAQKLGYRIFYYTPSNLSIIKNKTYANGVFVKFNYESKKFYKIYKILMSLIFCHILFIFRNKIFKLWLLLLQKIYYQIL